MSVVRDQIRALRKNYGPATSSVPQFFVPVAALGAVGLLASVFYGVMAAPANEPLFHFHEEGLVTVLSSIILSMTSALAAVVFLIRMKDFNTGTLFWLILSAGCLFFAFDENFMIHERSGVLVESGVGDAGWFRNWNDVIVILYGIGAIGVSFLFAGEIIRFRMFTILFGAAFGFYMIHTTLDAGLLQTYWWKDIVEESSKLVCFYFVLLATMSSAMTLIEKTVLPGSSSRSIQRPTADIAALRPEAIARSVGIESVEQDR